LFLILFSGCNKDSGTNNPIPPDIYNYDLYPGGSARDFLRNSSYTSLKIEIQYMPGLRSSSTTMDAFVNFLKLRLNKTSGIFIDQKEINPTLKTVLSVSDILDIENRNRSVFNEGNQLSAYILIIDGSYYSGSSLSLAYNNTSICLFGVPLKYYTLGLSEEAKSKIMAMLFEHEFGHLLGLVNMGTPMKTEHLDKENSNHCNNSNCLMHHTFESIVQHIDKIPDFDANCITDLKANGGK